MIRSCGLSACARGWDRLERLRVGKWGWLAAVAGCMFLAMMVVASPASLGSLGDFQGNSDVGGPMLPGSATFDASHGEYRVKGSGANIGHQGDSFRFLWRYSTGNLTMTANVHFPNAGGEKHRKAGLMVRQGMGMMAPYADAVVHGDGLTALQYRLVEGGPTQEVRSNISMPETIRLVRLGNTFSLWASRPGGPMELAGSVEVPMPDPVYAGMVVCSHNAEALEEAVFSKVVVLGTMTGDNFEARKGQPVESLLEVISVDGRERRVVYRANQRLEDANWSPDGKFFVFNTNGQLYTLPVAGGEPKHLDTGKEFTWSNDDHVISPDGKWVGISSRPGGARPAQVCVVPISGGEPRQVTQHGPSFCHGWSPDGKTLVFCGARNGNFDVYAIPTEGGDEVRLTDAPGLDDGPEYSPDGHYIYFNSERTGSMQIWRMKPDGSGQEQVTHDDYNYNNFFPHPSPDGKWLVFTTFDIHRRGTYQDAMIRIMPIEGSEPRVLAKIFGGGGTMNTPSWSPDGKHLAIVTYRLVKP